jgi:hypothetical protein
MFTFDVDSTIQFLVDNNLDRKNPNIEFFEKSSIVGIDAFYVKFEVRVSDNKTHKRIGCPVHMIFFGNTSVFYVVDKDRKFFGIPPAEKFINSSNHDSCWRSDGFQFLHNLYFEMCETVNEKVAPIKLDSTSTLLLWAKMEKIRIEFKKVEDYGYGLINIKQI